MNKYHCEPIIIISNLQFKFLTQLMFQSTQMNPHAKSCIQLKRDLLHQARVNEQRSKIKKSLRFSNLYNLVFAKHQPDAKFILQMPATEAQQRLRHLLQHQQFALLACCILQLQTHPSRKQQLDQILTLQFVSHFITASTPLLHRPEIIAVYKSLSCNSRQFYKVIFSHPQVIQNMTKEIQSMKASPCQELYLEVIQDLSARYPKTHTQDINSLFSTVFELLENDTISFQPGLKILKPLSLYISDQLQFASTTVNRLLTFYEQEMQKDEEHKDTMRNIFLVLAKVIYYQKNASIQTNWRLLKVVLHANSILPEKVIHGYYNFFLLIAKLVDKIARAQIEDLSSAELYQVMYKMVETYQVEYLPDTKPARCQLTTLLLNQLLNDCALLSACEFTPEYLHLLATVSKYCYHPVLLTHFHSASTLQFLAACIDHPAPDIGVLALQVFVILLDDPQENRELLQMAHNRSDLKTVLEDKLYRSQNPTVEKKITFILDKFDEFQNQI